MSTTQNVSLVPIRRSALLSSFGRQAVQQWKERDKQGTDDRSGYRSNPVPPLRK